VWFFSFLPVTERFFSCEPLIVLPTAYEVPPSATNSASVAMTVDGWSLSLDLMDADLRLGV
jgi:hypothetical protein